MRKRLNPFCTVDGCGKPAKGQGLCNNHYGRFMKYGRIQKLDVGHKRKHPYYSLWFERKQSGFLCEEWLDFWAFVQGVGTKPSKDHFLMRRGDEPYGPNNFMWVEHLRKRPGETMKQWWARKWAARMLANPGIERKRMFARKYGMTLEQYEALLAKQKGKCAICEQPETSVDGKSGSIKNLAVDHCHNSDKVRGLLCSRCNTTLGKIEESPQLLRAMWDYLYEHSKVEAA